MRLNLASSSPRSFFFSLSILFSLSFVRAKAEAKRVRASSSVNQVDEETRKLKEEIEAARQDILRKAEEERKSILADAKKKLREAEKARDAAARSRFVLLLNISSSRVKIF